MGPVRERRAGLRSEAERGGEAQSASRGRAGLLEVSQDGGPVWPVSVSTWMLSSCSGEAT